MDTISKKINTLIRLLIVIWIAGCANQLPPPGGPVDTIPPKIISIYPNSGTINYKENYIKVEFDEYVDKSSFQNSLFVSPATESEIKYDWSGKSVKVIFQEGLNKDLTYVITIGTDVKDLNNQNRLTEAYNLTFATGNKIDAGSVTGKIYTVKPQGVMLFAYTIGDSVIDPSIHKPKYLSQAGVSGNYEIKGMANGAYRIFAVRDEFNDLIYSLGEDEIGVPYQEVEITDNDSLFSGLNFFIQKEDTTSPRLISANMTDENHLIVEFSEVLDSSSLTKNKFTLFDSTENKPIKIDYLYNGKSKDIETILSFNSEINIENNLYLIVDSLKDQKNNLTKTDYISINISEKQDTLKPGITSIKSSSSNARVDVSDPKLILNFDDAVSQDKIESSIIIKDESEKILNFKYNKIDDAAFEISILDKLIERREYKLNIDLQNFIDAKGNFIDSVYTHKFIPLAKSDYSGASGKIFLDETRDKTIVVLQNTKDRLEYKTKLNSKDEFEFSNVEPGKYLVWVFYDEDENNEYSYGETHPYKLAEKFTFYPDTLNLRARWPVGDIKIKF